MKKAAIALAVLALGLSAAQAGQELSVGDSNLQTASSYMRKFRSERDTYLARNIAHEMADFARANSKDEKLQSYVIEGLLGSLHKTVLAGEPEDRYTAMDTAEYYMPIISDVELIAVGSGSPALKKEAVTGILKSVHRVKFRNCAKHGIAAAVHIAQTSDRELRLLVQGVLEKEVRGTAHNDYRDDYRDFLQEQIKKLY